MDYTADRIGDMAKHTGSILAGTGVGAALGYLIAYGADNMNNKKKRKGSLTLPLSLLGSVGGGIAGHYLYNKYGKS